MAETVHWRFVQFAGGQFGESLVWIGGTRDTNFEHPFSQSLACRVHAAGYQLAGDLRRQVGQQVCREGNAADAIVVSSCRWYTNRMPPSISSRLIAKASLRRKPVVATKRTRS